MKTASNARSTQEYLNTFTAIAVGILMATAFGELADLPLVVAHFATICLVMSVVAIVGGLVSFLYAAHVFLNGGFEWQSPLFAAAAFFGIGVAFRFLPGFFSGA